MEQKVQKSPFSWLVVMLICALTVGVVFGIYQVIEGFLLDRVSMHTIHTLHVLRGIFTAILVALLITLYILKSQLPSFNREFLIASTETSLVPESIANRTIQWFIGLRWIAFIITVLFLVVGVYLMEGIREREVRLPLIVVTLLVGLSNLFFNHFGNRWSPPKNFQCQILSDIVLLTLLLHFSGGAENPLFIIYIFHVILSSILLPSRQVYGFTFIICLLFCSMLLLELFQLVPHYTLNIFPHHNSHHSHASHQTHYVLPILGVFFLVMFLTAYFATTLAEGLRREMRLEKERTQQLLQATKMATMGEMIGFLAHEINNPMGVITLKVKKLLSSPSLSELDALKVQMVDKHIERISDIVKSLLGFTRQSASKKEPMDLPPVIRGSLHLSESRLRKEKISLHLQVPPSLPKICANFTELQQVLLNLIGNAIDAMPRGGALSICTSAQDSPPGGAQKEICLEVRDTGMGIAKEEQKKIFTSFYSTKGTRGTGLGLPVSSMLVRAHGGRIEVESEVGKGSSFKVFLPCCENGRENHGRNSQ